MQIAPAQSLVTCTTDEELAEHCMKHVMPDFRDKVRAGQKVLVAGKALGCGSSREAAVRALRGELFPIPILLTFPSAFIPISLEELSSVQYRWNCDLLTLWPKVWESNALLHGHSHSYSAAICPTSVS